MSEKGYFIIDRSLMDNPIWQNRPFAYGQAWVDLIMLANHKNVKQLKNGKIQTFKRGTVNRSIMSLAERWGWTRKAVRKFLKILETDQMVSVLASTNGATRGTTITLLNYDKYQNLGTTKETTTGSTRAQQRDNNGTTTGHKQIMKKNEKNEKNDVYAQPQQPPTLEEVRSYVKASGLSISPERFWRYYDENGWKLSGGGPVRSWKLAAQKWRDDWHDERRTDEQDRDPHQRDEYGGIDEELFGEDAFGQVS